MLGDVLIVVCWIAAAVCAVAYAMEWRARTRGHDGEWKPTGVRQLHKGHDQRQGERAWAKSRRQSATGRVWQVKKPGSVVPFEQPRRDDASEESPAAWPRR